MTPQDRRKRRALRNQVTSQSDRHKLLDTLLALDRKVVELSMRAYKIPRRDRMLLRAQSRRLHDAVRNNRLVPRAYLLQRAWPLYPSADACPESQTF